jgi:[ribosomal protein S5]-alanine N-acetyltransferase
MIFETETERVVLRDPRKDDAFDIFNNYAQDPEVTKYLVWQPHKTIETTKKFIDLYINKNKVSDNLVFSIYHKTDRQVIGMIEFNLDGFKATFGYVLSKKYWNTGIMTESMKPILNYIFKLEKIKRIWATHNINNEASGKVMVKLGMSFEGVLRKNIVYPNISTEPQDTKIYSLVK